MIIVEGSPNPTTQIPPLPTADMVKAVVCISPQHAVVPGSSSSSLQWFLEGLTQSLNARRTSIHSPHITPVYLGVPVTLYGLLLRVPPRLLESLEIEDHLNGDLHHLGRAGDAARLGVADLRLRFAGLSLTLQEPQDLFPSMAIM